MKVDFTDIELKYIRSLVTGKFKPTIYNEREFSILDKISIKLGEETVDEVERRRQY